MNSPVPWNVASAGKRFVEHYQQNGYKEIAGGLLLSDALPMTFVMSAGMVQFEMLAPIAQAGDRYVLIQNCFRHTDIERVRESAFHLSLFQMPGAFVFGPLDRQKHIAHIWDLLTRIYGFDSQRLYVTYFSGGKIEGHIIPPDEETASAWKSVGVPDAHIIGLKKDNFWRQSARMVGVVNSRKCGPNTEVFYDRGAATGCRENTCQPGCSCGRFVEFLNHLFISLQIDESKGKIVPLDIPFTETVIGRERVAALLNHADSVYQVDTIQPLIQQIECFDKFMPESEDACLRHRWVIADHLRALLFLIHDGAPQPGKGGRARLMRVLARELLISQRLLGISDPGFLRSLTIVALEVYQHLTRQMQECFLDMLMEEDTLFEQTIQKGLGKLEERLKINQPIAPVEIVRFEKIGGIPFDLLYRTFQQKNVSFDMTAYQKELSDYLQEVRAASD